MRRIRPLLFFLFCAGMMALGGCMLEGEPKPRPGVREAKACLRTLGGNRDPFPGYKIDSCGPRGVWVVEQLDPEGLLVAKFDFVNRLYAGAETGGGFVDVLALGSLAEERFDVLEKEINRAVLAAAGE